MARSKEYYFKGKCKFFKLLPPGDVEYRKWSTVLYFDPDSYSQFMELKKSTDDHEGILNDVKMDDDGGYYATLGRPFTKKFKNGQEQALTPPIVLDKDNLPWQENSLVGNGSDITVKCEWYTFMPPFKKKKGSAIRLVSARVDNLIPYEMRNDFNDEQHKMVSGLIQQPKPMAF